MTARQRYLRIDGCVCTKCSNVDLKATGKTSQPRRFLADCARIRGRHHTVRDVGCACRWGCRCIDAVASSQSRWEGASVQRAGLSLSLSCVVWEKVMRGKERIPCSRVLLSPSLLLPSLDAVGFLARVKSKHSAATMAFPSPRSCALLHTRDLPTTDTLL